MDTRLVNPHDCQYVQSRVSLNVFAVAEYEGMMEQGIVFDPCQGIVCEDGAIIIYDGNHRAEAAKNVGAMIQVELTPGTAREADWYAAGANTKHGIRRTVSDIEKSVKAALRHANAQGRSDREIARHCGCDHKTVGKYRKELEASGERPQIPVKTVTRNGSEYQMTIPMPKEPEPEPEQALAASPMCYDEHMHMTDIKTEWGDCPNCGTPVGVVLKTWREGPFTRFNIRCQECLHTWSDSLLYQRECYLKNREHPRFGPISERPNGRDSSAQTPEPDDGLQYCADCGTVIAPGYEAEYQGQLYHANCQYRLTHPTENDTEYAECDFCGDRFPIARLYGPRNGDICRTCASKALHALLDQENFDVIEDAHNAEEDWQ